MDKTIAAFTEPTHAAGTETVAYINAREISTDHVAVTLRARGAQTGQEMVMSKSDFAAFIREAQGNL